jgi:hypothetical protein
MNAVVSILLVIALIVFAFVFRYQVVPVGNQSHRIDRFTGQTSICDDRGCRPIENHSAESWKAVETKRRAEATSAAEPSARPEKRPAKERRQEERPDKEPKSPLEGVREKIDEALKRIK